MNNSSQLTKWWEETLEGEAKSFSRIHDELYSSLYFYLLKIIKDEDAAQDILQDLFIKMWERKERLGRITNVKYYFYKSARSFAINYLKAARPELLDLQNHQCVNIEFSPEDIIVNREAGIQAEHMLSTALNLLPKRQKEMIFLRYFDDWSYDQIAEVTGLQYQSVVNHVHRGINQMRHIITENKKMLKPEMAV